MAGADPEQSPEQAPGQGVWMSVVEAARLLGVSQQAVRDRIGRGTLDVRRETHGNRSRLLVRVDQAVEQGAAQVLEQRLAELLAPRLEQSLEHQLAKRLEDKEAHIADLRAEVARLNAELARRRWPGLKAWWWRLWSGEAPREVPERRSGSEQNGA